MDSIQPMTIEEESIRKWCEEASEHEFHLDKSIYISDLLMGRDTPFGIKANGDIFILLNEYLCDSPFKISDLIELTSAKSFVSESEGTSLYGCGLSISTNSIEEQVRTLALINNILERDSNKSDLYSFFELIRKAAQRSKNFYAPSLFAELCVLKALQPQIPNIISCWKSSGQSIVDICSSSNSPEIEVKSTTNLDSRVHTLSLHQVRHFLEHRECLVASVQVHEDSEAGTSCKILCEELLKHEQQIQCSVGIKILTSYLLSYSSKPGFCQMSFNEVLTKCSIIYIRPDFSGLSIQTPPPWLNSASFEIDFSLMPSVTNVSL